MDRERGKIVGGLGRAGHMAGEFNYPHTLVTDRRGNLYTAETGLNRRVQKFRKVQS